MQVAGIREAVHRTRKANFMLMEDVSSIVADVSARVSVKPSVLSVSEPSWSDDECEVDVPVLKFNEESEALIGRLQDTPLSPLSSEDFLNLMAPSVEQSPPSSPSQSRQQSSSSSRLDPLARVLHSLSQVYIFKMRVPDLFSVLILMLCRLN